MSVIALFSGIFCNEDSILQVLEKSTEYRLITDDMITTLAWELSDIPKHKINQAFSSTTSVFNKFTHEKERSIAFLKLALARLIESDNVLVTGYVSLLIPESINPVLRVCLTAKNEYRITQAKQTQQIPEEEAAKIIFRDDQDRSFWTHTLFSKEDPWNSDLYDMVLNTDKMEPQKASVLIMESLSKEALRPTQSSKAALQDFLLAAKTEVTLINAGHNVSVQAEKGIIILTINKHVLMLNRLEDELKTIAGKVPGVLAVETRLCRHHTSRSITYKKFNTRMPSKVLLVDDEKEFVQTLSERLQMREMGSVVAYDGISALKLVRHDHPEVMIIDLKMPEMDGMEILKQVKQIQPTIEVIVLTGHGSEQDRLQCMHLGAFAYMQKPVDINLLSTALQQAHEKVKSGIEKQK